MIIVPTIPAIQNWRLKKDTRCIHQNNHLAVCLIESASNILFIYQLLHYAILIWKLFTRVLFSLSLTYDYLSMLVNFFHFSFPISGIVDVFTWFSTNVRMEIENETKEFHVLWFDLRSVELLAISNWTFNSQ